MRAPIALILSWAVTACAQRDVTSGAPSPTDWTSTPSSFASAPPRPPAVSSSNAPDEAVAVPSATPATTDANAPLRVVDLHVDTPYQIVQKGRKIELSEGHATIPSLLAGRYAGIVYPIYIADYLHGGRPKIADADRILSVIDELVTHHDALVFERDGGGDAKRITVYLAIEGAGAFAEDITQIDRFIQRGIRFVGPVHAKDNELASSATGAGKGAFGLTELGEKFCRRVYDKGGLIDVSHMSDAAFADLVPIAASFGAPIVATHSNARALAQHPRNLTDEQLRTIARSGGVAGLNLHGQFLTTRGAASMDDAVAQVLHMVEIAGADHVAIGSDFDGGNPPADFADASGFVELARRLRARGLTRRQVSAIFSGNAMRVLGFGSHHNDGSKP